MGVPESFRTARLQAERLAPHHQAELVEFHRDPRVMAELGGIRDEEQTDQYLSRNLDHWQEHGFGVWVLRWKDGSEFIGRAVLRYLPLEGRREVEVGFALYPRFWGQGLATEVGNACAAIAWNDLGVESLVGVTTPSNHASQRVLLKLGLHFEREVVVDQSPYLLYRADASSPKRWQRSI